jgi:predicted NAD-dependent protein-ADP-ribosyltransferase YbiA (DUF1768 family)
MTIDKFEGEYRFLSNFYPQPVIFEGMLFPSVEHAYQEEAQNKIEVGGRSYPGVAR